MVNVPPGTHTMAAPSFGLVLGMLAALVTVNTVALVAVPSEVVTVIVPVLAPLGTVAVMVVAFSTDIVVAVVPLNFTTVAPVK